MEIIEEKQAAVKVFRLNGRLDSNTSLGFEERIFDAISDGSKQMVIDFKDIDYISSAGLRVMIDVQKTCMLENRGELVLVEVQKRIYDTLELAGFVSLFKFFDDIENAVQQF